MRNNPDYSYIGCFFQPDSLFSSLAHLRSHPLFREIDAPHVTFAFNPDTVDTALFGEQLAVTVIGYGADEENEGVLVRLSSENPRIQEYIDRIAVPHITLSVSKTGKPVNTTGLHFATVEPVPLTGTFGGYTWDHRVILSSL